ncbi:MAG: ABC transporter permease [Oscillospiraceae bacterium]|nr:ABC transporter permease [Oscillospiraceae bacterium]
MINSMQAALIIKDIRAVTGNKQLLAGILILPLFMAVILPSIFILTIGLSPEDSSDFQELLVLLPGMDENMQDSELRAALIRLMLDSIVPMFFLMIPILAATVMAASAFVGEKEKRTLETLLYCPMSLRQIFSAKILASLILSQFVSFISFLAMTLVVQIELWFITGTLILPGLNWLVLMLILSPAMSLTAISLIVRGSAKAKSMEEAQTQSLFLIMPVILLAGGQFSGVFTVSVLLLLSISVVCGIIGLVLLRRASANFHYERLLL